MLKEHLPGSVNFYEVRIYTGVTIIPMMVVLLKTWVLRLKGKACSFIKSKQYCLTACSILPLYYSLNIIRNKFVRFNTFKVAQILLLRN